MVIFAYFHNSFLGINLLLAITTIIILSKLIKFLLLLLMVRRSKTTTIHSIRRINIGQTHRIRKRIIVKLSIIYLNIIITTTLYIRIIIIIL